MPPSVDQIVGTTRFAIRAMYPLTLLEGQGMGTAYEYYSKLRVMARVFARTGAPRSLLVLGLPEKHGYDLDFVLLAHYLRQRTSWVRAERDARAAHGERSAEPGRASPAMPLIVCEDRFEVLAQFRSTLEQLPDPEMARHVELVQVDRLTDCLTGRRFDWIISTASVQRLPNKEIVAYLQNARQMADHVFLFIPNGGNRAHLTLSGLRGLDLDETLALCQHVGTMDPGPRHPPSVLAAGYCDIPPFPPGLRRSTEAKERAMHSPLETLAMWCLQWWCRGEPRMPRMVQKRLAHLVYVALDLREDAP